MAKRRKAARQRRTRLVVALERARESLTQEMLSKALAELPGTTTIGEVISSLRSAGYSRDLESMSLDGFVAAVGGDGAAAPSMGGASRKKATRKVGRRKGGRRKAAGGGAGKRLNTRTSEGRDAMDAAITEFLTAHGSGRAEDIRAVVGGTSAQVRQSLARLVDARKVSKSGQKRATEYAWGKGKGGAARKTKARKAKAGNGRRKARRKTGRRAAKSATSAG